MSVTLFMKRITSFTQLLQCAFGMNHLLLSRNALTITDTEGTTMSVTEF